MFSFKATWASLVALGPAAMFVVTAADTAILPTAQAVDLLILTQAVAAPDTAWLLGFFAVAGSTFGGMSLYFASRKSGGWALRKSVSEERVEQIRSSIEKYDALALFLPTASPIPLSPMKICIAVAGALKLSPVRSALAIAAGRTIRYFGLIFLAVNFGDHALQIVDENMWLFVVAMTALVGCAALIRMLRLRRAPETLS